MKQKSWLGTHGKSNYFKETAISRNEISKEDIVSHTTTADVSEKVSL